MTSQKTASIKPSSFTDDSERDVLLASTCEEVVERKYKQESKRTSRMEDDQECEVRVHCRTAPYGLIVSLDALADSLSRSRRVTVKCLSHHGVALLSTVQDIVESNQIYGDIIRLHSRYGGLVDLVEQMDIVQYRHANERSCDIDLVLAKKLLGSIGQSCRGIAIDSCDLLAVSLAWSLSTTQDESLLGTVKDLSVCLSGFRQFVFERAIIMRAYKEIALSRIKQPQK